MFSDYYYLDLLDRTEFYFSLQYNEYF
jgi:hypothetical protein